MNSSNIIRTFLIYIIFHCVVIICSCLAESAHIEDVNYVLAKIDEANKGVASLKADITIVRSIPLLESEEVSKGKLIYQKPKLVYIKFDPPRNEINVIDSENIWIYHIDLKQVEKYAINDIGENLFMNTFIGFGFDNDKTIDTIKEKYDISMADYQKNVDNLNKDNGGKNRLHKLSLIPKSDKISGNYTEIKLWVDNKLWLPVIFELYESGGEILNRIELSNVVINKDISLKNFGFDIPKDVEIIEPLR